MPMEKSEKQLVNTLGDNEHAAPNKLAYHSAQIEISACIKDILHTLIITN